MSSASANGLSCRSSCGNMSKTLARHWSMSNFIWCVVKWFNARHIRVIGGYYSITFVYLVFLGRTKGTLLVIVENDI